MRMPRQGRRNQNALNMESSRMRLRYHMISWHPTTNETRDNRIRQLVVSQLTRQQIAANTTRGITPGLISPLQGEAGGRVAHPVLSHGQGTVRGPRITTAKAKGKGKQAGVPNNVSDGDPDVDAEETVEAEPSRNIHRHCPSLVSSPFLCLVLSKS